MSNATFALKYRKAVRVVGLRCTYKCEHGVRQLSSVDLKLCNAFVVPDYYLAHYFVFEQSLSSNRLLISQIYLGS
jgi:hypothetical protein